jgi:hypothetical protein
MTVMELGMTNIDAADITTGRLQAGFAPTIITHSELLYKFATFTTYISLCGKIFHKIVTMICLAWKLLVS